MALRYYIPHKTLKGDTFRIEIHDADFVGTAAEVNGRYSVLELNYSGQTDDLFSPVLTSSATFRMLITAGEPEESLVTDLATAREGRFHLVVKRGGSLGLEWVGYVLPDETTIEDKHKFTLSIFAVDGIARLKDLDYIDPATEESYSGRQTFAAHIFQLINDHIDLMGITATPAARLISNCNWFADEMVTTTDPLAQGAIDNDRFVSYDRDGNKIYWSCFDVLVAICRQFGARFYFAAGSYHFMQMGEYANPTQKTYHYNNTGSIFQTNAAVNFDKNIDYTDAAQTRFKIATGQFTHLQPIKKVRVDYFHQTHLNRAAGFSFNHTSGPFSLVSLPGEVTVDANNTTQLHFILNFRVKTNGLDPAALGYNVYPPHRQEFAVVIKIGSFYLKGGYSGTIFTSLNDDVLEWTTNNTDNLTFLAPIVSESEDGQFLDFSLNLTTPFLFASMSGNNIEISINRPRVIGPTNEDILTNPNVIPGIFGYIAEDLVFEVLEEGIGDNPGSDVLRFCATDPDEGNTSKVELETWFGSGPQPYSTSRITVGSQSASDWKVGGTGTGYPINDLLSREILAARRRAVKVYQGTYHGVDFDVFSRFVDVGEGLALVPLRLRYSTYLDFWEGEFGAVLYIAPGIVSEPPIPVGNGNPTAPNPSTPDPYDPGPGRIPISGNPPPTTSPNGNTQGVMGWNGTNSSSPTTLSSGVAAATYNGGPKEVTINAVNFPFVFAGDTVSLINPATGYSEEFTVAADYEPGSTTLELTEDMVNDFPVTSFVVPAAPILYQLRGWSHKQFGFTGTELAIPTTTGYLPNPGLVTEAEIDRRVQVVSGGTVWLYSPTERAGCFTILAEFNKVKFWNKQRAADVLVVVR